MAAAGLTIPVISDQHKGIVKYIRDTHPVIKHFFDQWHVAKGLVKSKIGGKSLILAKWKSLIQHIANKHEDHPDRLFPKCAHGETEKRKWIKVGTKAYDKLQGILMKKIVLNDIEQLYPNAQTSALEGFRSTLIQWHPRMLCFSWFGTYCRHILASLNLNENINRKSQTSKSEQHVKGNLKRLMLQG
ncbi:uncharacterized protein LOC114518617 [Dendronephthya gigantea]|uniref:uncharacterized protein LOC114518617 n=1 Tax=Dendronephthya gigantea TaxID=151771 RepID=UPI00106A242C|nr:uncharacterized protein LOC114518617 [Dendronephthya gigantea]